MDDKDKENIDTNIIDDFENKDDIINEDNTIFNYDLLSKITSAKLGQYVCKLKIEKENSFTTGTGFFCDIPSKNIKFLITNNHLINQNFLDNKDKLTLTIKNNDKEQEIHLKLTKSIRYKYTDKEFDFTIIEILEEDPIENFFEIDENFIEKNNLKNKLVFSIQYPKGGDLKISFGRIIESEFGNNKYFLYNIGTDKGSSGSPIILTDNLKVIGLYKAALQSTSFDKDKKKNIGIPFNKIIEKIPKKGILSERKNMIKCIYCITKEDVNKNVKIYNNRNNLEKKIKKVSIHEESEENNKIKNGNYIFNKEGKYCIQYYIDEEIDNLSYMFSDCPSLYKVSLVSFNNSNITDISNMFSNCNSLKEINLSSFNTSNVTDMSNLFSYCKSLKKINFKSFNTSNVISMPNMFCECNSLEEVNLSSFNTSKVTDISHMFSNCNYLKEIDLSSFNTINVIDMSYMFKGCNSLEKINISSFNTSNVLDMSNMFSECNSLKGVNLTSFNTKKVTNMSNMFKECNSLEELALSSFNTSNVVNMSNMFKECNSLERLALSSFNTGNVVNMSNMFKGCNSLEELDLSSFNTINATNMSFMFSQCKSLKEINLKSFNAKNAEINNMFLGCSLLKQLNASDEKIIKEYSKIITIN